jgi:hypothetical protein
MCLRMLRSFEADVMYQDAESTQYELKYTWTAYAYRIVFCILMQENVGDHTATNVC